MMIFKILGFQDSFSWPYQLLFTLTYNVHLLRQSADITIHPLQASHFAPGKFKNVAFLIFTKVIHNPVEKVCISCLVWLDLPSIKSH